jgi:hypothetical protein
MNRLLLKKLTWLTRFISRFRPATPFVQWPLAAAARRGQAEQLQRLADEI